MSDSGQLIIQINLKNKSEVHKLKKDLNLKIFLNKKIGDLVKLKINSDNLKTYKITGGSTIYGVPLYKSVKGLGNVYIKSKVLKKQRVHSNNIDQEIKSISLVQINENTTNI